uniref:Repressor domain protein n=1 Tax=Siphoviridae sp. ctmxA102 TaxID=2825657 RepID=A0A8S5TVY0_9CAUD|nr:MAG TPA: repressor domain protein [Siphoviridae sp. ctmxA102]
MAKIKIWENQEFGVLRVLDEDGDPWMVGKDVAIALGYTNPRKALADHVDVEDKRQGDGVKIRDSIGRAQAATLINESGLYSLVLSSKLPGAKRFRRWVTGEVLPSIRKDGGYIKTAPGMTDADIMAKAILLAQKTIVGQKAQIAEMTPKALFADAVSASSTSILVGDLAKLIRQNGMDIGQNRLFDWLRNNGYLIRAKGMSWNMPTQRSRDMGLFEVKETSITHSDGHISVNKTVKVTGKGQIYFVNKLIPKKGE